MLFLRLRRERPGRREGEAQQAEQDRIPGLLHRLYENLVKIPKDDDAGTQLNHRPSELKGIVIPPNFNSLGKITKLAYVALGEPHL